MRISDRSSDVYSSDLACDSYHRFIAMYAEIVLGLDGEAFDRLLETAREWDCVELDRDISADTLRHLCGRYQQIVAEQSGAPFPQDPEVQLRQATAAVFRSWGGARAVAAAVTPGHEWGREEGWQYVYVQGDAVSGKIKKKKNN